MSVGEHDFRVTVDDPGWDVQSVVMDRTEENVLGLKAGSNFLRDAVHADDRRLESKRFISLSILRLRKEVAAYCEAGWVESHLQDSSMKIYSLNMKKHVIKT